MSHGPVGRFAPSPTGPLHLGSVMAALGSYLQAKSRGGRWLVRIEDIDPPREVPGAARAQLATLARLGLKPDSEVVWQSRERARHQAAIDRLLAAGHAFHCSCSRRDLPAGGTYPGTCRDGIPAGRTARSIRARVDNRTWFVKDLLQPEHGETPAETTGDFVIRRADDCIAYQLAVVVDDAAQGVTEIVRGADLLDSTPRQMLLQARLDIPHPAYAHLPVLIDTRGEKLGKSTAAEAVDALPPETCLKQILTLLGHDPPPHLDSRERILDWAVANWRLERVPPGPLTPGVHTA